MLEVPARRGALYERDAEGGIRVRKEDRDEQARAGSAAQVLEEVEEQEASALRPPVARRGAREPRIERVPASVVVGEHLVRLVERGRPRREELPDLGDRLLDVVGLLHRAPGVAQV